MTGKMRFTVPKKSIWIIVRMSLELQIPAQFEKRKKNHTSQKATWREIRSDRSLEYMKEFSCMRNELQGKFQTDNIILIIFYNFQLMSSSIVRTQSLLNIFDPDTFLKNLLAEGSKIVNL